jgi:hypothetical protein
LHLEVEQLVAARAEIAPAALERLLLLALSLDLLHTETRRFAAEG